MSSRVLVVRYLSVKQGLLEWFLFDQRKFTSSIPEQGTLEQLAQVAKGKRIIFLVSGSSLLLTNVKLPEGNQRILARALPYTLEEQLAEDLDNLHIVPASLNPGGKTPVAVIRRQLLIDMLTDLASVGIHPQKLLPETLSLPWHEDSWSLLYEEARVIVRMGEFSGFECSPALLRPLLSRILAEKVSGEGGERSEEHTQPQLLDIYGNMPATLIEGVKSDGFSLNFVPELSTPIMSYIGNRRSGFNLLQGLSLANTSSRAKANWWLSSSMLLLAFLIFVGVSGYQYWSLQQQLEEKQNQIIALFRNSFPEVKRVVDPLQQARQLLERRKRERGEGDDHLLTLLYRAGQAQQKDRTLIFNTVEYRDGVLQIRMSGRSVESIEQFKQQVENNPKTSAEILSTIVQETGIEARIKIQGGRS